MRRNPFVYYGKKVLVFLVSVFILSVTVFYISRLAPGDPLMSYYGERVEKMSVAEKEAARTRDAILQKTAEECDLLRAQARQNSARAIDAILSKEV